MSRRKQANPAKLGDGGDAKIKIINEDRRLSAKRLDESSDEKEENEDDEEGDTDTDAELREIDNECLDNEEFDDVSIGLNGRTSSPSSSNQSSPTSCQSFTLSDTTEGDEICTVGATAATPHECIKCKRAFSRSSVLNKHLQIHTDQLQFSCPYCKRLFKHKRSRDRHTKLHTGDKKYKCTHCDSAFARSDHLKIHMKTHDNKKPHQCELCNRGYNTAAALASHQQHHIKKEVRSGSSISGTPSPGHIRCPQCSELFSKPEQLQAHNSVCKHKTSVPTIPSSSTPDKTLSKAVQNDVSLAKMACMYCGKDYPNMTEIYQHIRLDHNAIFFPKHSQVNYNPDTSPTPSLKELSPKLFTKNFLPTYACDLCTVKFENSESLKEHIESSHYHWKLSNSVENISSTSSPQSKPTDLSRKRRVEEVALEQRDKRKLDEHIRTSPSSASSPYDSSSDKPCICSYCYVQMPNFKSFLIHMESHVSLNSTSTFIGYCPVCGEPGRDPAEFSSHIFGHVVSDMTGRCCHHCKKSFDQLEQLQKHLLDMHSQNIYKCTICGELFESETAIKVHFNSKHCTECKHYRCNLCSHQYFHDKLTAELHVSMRHGSNLSGTRNHLLYQTYQCPFCQKSFKDEYTRHFHLLKEHDTIGHDGRENDSFLMDVSAATVALTSGSSPNFQYRPLSPSTVVSQDIANTADLKLLGCYSCELCNRMDFSTESELAAHRKMHHQSAKSSKIGTVSLQCAYCNEHCKSRTDLENHMKNHQVSGGKGKHKCNICDEIFSTAMTLADHKLTHCKIVSGNTCTQCKTVLNDEQCFYAHQLQHNNVNSSTLAKSNSQISLPANCVICCQTLQTDIEMKLHAKFHLKHLLQKERIIFCILCNKVCQSDGQNMPDRSNGSIFVCKNCKGTNGVSETTYRPMQEQRDLNDLQYNVQTICLQNLDKSEEVEDGENCICRLCRNILPSIAKLQIHLIEHNFMGMGQFRCYVCSSVFTTAAGLQGHIIGHGLNQSPYECVECKTKFFFETELENHRISHALTRNVKTKTPNSQSPESELYYDKMKNEKRFKICYYCSGVFQDSLFAEHVEKCCKVEIKTEEINDEEYDKTKDNYRNSDEQIEESTNGVLVER